MLNRHLQATAYATEVELGLRLIQLQSMNVTAYATKVESRLRSIQLRLMKRVPTKVELPPTGYGLCN